MILQPSEMAIPVSSRRRGPSFASEQAVQELPEHVGNEERRPNMPEVCRGQGKNHPPMLFLHTEKALRQRDSIPHNCSRLQ